MTSRYFEITEEKHRNRILASYYLQAVLPPLTILQPSEKWSNISAHVTAQNSIFKNGKVSCTTYRNLP